MSRKRQNNLLRVIMDSPDRVSHQVRRVRHLSSSSSSSSSSGETNKIDKSELEQIQRQENDGIRDAKLKVLTDLSSILNDNKFSDVKIILNNSILHAHKAILSARSTVFAAAIENSSNEIHVTDIRDVVFEELLRFIYTGSVNDIDDLSMELLVAADKYKLEDLKDLCSLSISRNFTIDRATTIFIMADQLNVASLKLFSINYINKNAAKVIETEGYRSLVKYHLPLIEELYRYKNNPRVHLS